MSSKDLGNQLDLATKLRDALTEVAAAYEKLGKSAGSQTDAVRDIANGMKDMSDKSPEKDLNDMSSALDELGKRVTDAGPRFKKFAKVAVVALASAKAGANAFRQTLGATMNIVGGLTSSIFNLAKGGIGALVGSYKAMIGLAQDVAAQMDVVAQAAENLRGEFGDLASNEGQAVMGAIGNLRSEFGKTAGMSLGRVFGPGADGMAAAMAAMGEMAGELGAKLNLLMDDVAENAAAMMTLNRGFNLSAEAMGNMALMARQSGGDMTTALEETAVQVAVLSKQFGVSGKTIGKNLSELTADMGSFGHMSQAELTATATYAAKLGVEIGTLKGMFDKFANFEDAATGAAKLAETFGMNVDAMELMNAESPAEQMDMMRQAFMETGRSLDDLSRQEKAYLAEQMGVDPNDLYGMFDPSNADLSFDEITAEAEAAAEKMSPEDAMKEAAKSIEKSIQSAMEKVEGFIDAFVKGFAYALKFTEPFMKATQSIRNALREVFHIGGELARELFGKGGAFHPQSMHGVSLLQKVLGNRNDPKSVVGIFVVLKDAIVALAKGEIDFKGLIKKMGKTLTDFVQTPHFQELGSYLLTGLEKAIGFVLKSATGLINMLADGMSEEFTGIDFFGDAQDPINKSLTKIFETISDNMGPLKKALGKLVGAIFDAIIGFLEDNPKILAGALALLFGPAVISGALSALSAAFTTYIATALVTSIKAGAIPAIVSGFGTAFTAVSTFITTTALPAIGAALSSFAGGIVSIFTSAAAVLVTKIIVAAAVIYGTVMSFFQTFTRIFDRFGDDSKGTFEKIVGAIVDIFMFIPRAIVNVVNLITETFFGVNIVEPFDNAVNMIIDMFVFLKDDLFAFVGNVIGFFTNGGITEAVNGVVASIIDFFTGAPKAMYDGLMGFVGMLGGFAKSVLKGIMAPFNDMGKNIAKAASDAWDSFKGVFRIGSPSKAAEEVGGQIVDGMAQGTKNMDGALKGPSQKSIDKIAKDMNKLDTSKINEASGKFMDLEQVSQSLNNVNAGLKELETGVSSKKLAAAAKELPLAIKELMKMGESIVAFGAEKGKETISKMNGSLHFFADRIPQIATKIKTIADSLNEMGASLETLVSTTMGQGKVDKVVKVLEGIFGKGKEETGALIPEMKKAFDQANTGKSLENLNKDMMKYEPMVKVLAYNVVSMSQSMESMLDAVEKMTGVIPERSTKVKETIEAVVAKMEEVNGAIASIESVEAVTKLQKIANGLASDGTVSVQYEQMQLNVNFTVQIDATDLASAIGEDAKGGSFFVINQDRGGGGAGQAETAGG